MYPILFAQWMRERRSPFLLLLFISLSVIAVILFGKSSESRMQVDVIIGEEVTVEAAEKWIELLNNEAFEFNIRDEQQAMSLLQEGRSAFAVRLLHDDFHIVATMADYNIQLVEQHMLAVFQKELQLRAAAEQADDPERFRQDVQQYLEQPPLLLQMTAPDGEKIVSYDMGMQLMFGFAMFLVMFTIGFKINAINSEKTSGIWNRMILSPVRKTQMYLGHLVYSSVIGFVQILIVYLIFLYLFGFKLGERFGIILLVTAIYVIAVVAIATLFTGITNTPEKFNMLYPSIIPIIPLISGIYMPPGTITNSFLQFLAEFLPLTHAMEALMGITIYNAGWPDLFMPLSKLLLIAVICMGVGINLVERGRR